MSIQVVVSCTRCDWKRTVPSQTRASSAYAGHDCARRRAAARQRKERAEQLARQRQERQERRARTQAAKQDRERRRAAAQVARDERQAAARAAREQRRADTERRRAEHAKASELLAARLEGRRQRAAEGLPPDRTPVACLHPTDQHEHGTIACYNRDHCRCQPCTLAASRSRAASRRSSAHNQWTPTVPAEAPRAHVRHLVASGMSLAAVSAGADVPEQDLNALLYGTRVPHGRGRREAAPARLPQPVAERILAVATSWDADAPVHGCGSRRRLQGLVAIGYPPNVLARRLSWDAERMRAVLLEQAPMTAGSARAVSRLYDALSMRPYRPDSEAGQAAAVRARGLARRRRWAPPLGRDDDLIDDPSARAGELLAVTVEGDVPEVGDVLQLRAVARGADRTARLFAGVAAVARGGRTGRIAS